MSLARAYLALGGNLGDRVAYLESALQMLHANPHLEVAQVSPVYENRAVGMGPADPFLNAVAEVETTLEPLALLELCLEVETKLGRVRSGVWAPRTIDLDVIAYGEASISTERLQLPHPRIRERDFVLHPLNAIAPDLRIGDSAVKDLAAAVSQEGLTKRDIVLNFALKNKELPDRSNETKPRN